MRVFIIVLAGVFGCCCIAFPCEESTPCATCIEKGCVFFMDKKGFVCGDPSLNINHALRIRRVESCAVIGVDPIPQTTDPLHNANTMTTDPMPLKSDEGLQVAFQNDTASPTASKLVTGTEAFLEAKLDTFSNGPDFYFAESVCRQYAYVHSKLHPKKPAQKHAAAYRKCVIKMRGMNRCL